MDLPYTSRDSLVGKQRRCQRSPGPVTLITWGPVRRYRCPRTLPESLRPGGQPRMRRAGVSGPRPGQYLFLRVSFSSSLKNSYYEVRAELAFRPASKLLVSGLESASADGRVVAGQVFPKTVQPRHRQTCSSPHPIPRSSGISSGVPHTRQITAEQSPQVRGSSTSRAQAGQ